MNYAVFTTTEINFGFDMETDGCSLHGNYKNPTFGEIFTDISDQFRNYSIKSIDYDENYFNVLGKLEKIYCDRLNLTNLKQNSYLVNKSELASNEFKVYGYQIQSQCQKKLSVIQDKVNEFVIEFSFNMYTVHNCHYVFEVDLKMEVYVLNNYYIDKTLMFCENNNIANKYQSYYIYNVLFGMDHYYVRNTFCDLLRNDLNDVIRVEKNTVEQKLLNDESALNYEYIESEKIYNIKDAVNKFKNLSESKSYSFFENTELKLNNVETIIIENKTSGKIKIKYICDNFYRAVLHINYFKIYKISETKNIGFHDCLIYT